MQSRPRWTHKDLHGSVDAGQLKVAPALVTQIGDWLSLSRAVLHSLCVAAQLRVALWQYFDFGCRFVPSREHLCRRRDNVADLHVVLWMIVLSARFPLIVLRCIRIVFGMCFVSTFLTERG